MVLWKARRGKKKACKIDEKKNIWNDTPLMVYLLRNKQKQQETLKFYYFFFYFFIFCKEKGKCLAFFKVKVKQI